MIGSGGDLRLVGRDNQHRRAVGAQFVPGVRDAAVVEPHPDDGVGPRRWAASIMRATASWRIWVSSRTSCGFRRPLSDFTPSMKGLNVRAVTPTTSPITARHLVTRDAIRRDDQHFSSPVLWRDMTPQAI